MNQLVAILGLAAAGFGIYKMSKKRVFISFDYDHDRHYRYLLKALSRNSGSDIAFDDLTPGEIQSSAIDRIKGVLTQKIDQASHTLVIIGEHANYYHPDRKKIGTRNWQWWEIEKSLQMNKKLIAVKTHKNNRSPEILKEKGASWAQKFSEESILKAIRNA